MTLPASIRKAETCGRLKAFPKEANDEEHKQRMGSLKLSLIWDAMRHLTRAIA
jgi:hypothetical protein